MYQYEATYRIPITKKTMNLFLDRQCLHRAVNYLFRKNNDSENIEEFRKRTNVLFRLEDNKLKIRADVSPKNVDNIFECISENFDSKKEFQRGERYQFSVLVSPTVKNNKTKTRHFIKDASDRNLWIQEKGRKNGFRVVTSMEINKDTYTISHGEKKGGSFSLIGVENIGILEVTDPEKFSDAYRKGIGKGKAYGFGMLTLKKK